MNSPFSLSGRTILVTGASSGIGRCIALQASRAGARLVLTGRSGERLKETEGQLEGTGHLSIKLDLGDTAKIEPCITNVLKEAGPLSGFVHSAGVSAMTLLRDASPEHMEDMMRVNWLSFMELSRVVCRRGRYAPGLSVVAVASISASTPQPGLSVYGATKGALISAARSLAAEYASRGIRFNCVSPANVDTPMQQEARRVGGEEWYQREVLDRAKLGLLSPEDIANPVVFLLSDAARRITAANMIIDGGYSFS